MLHNPSAARLTTKFIQNFLINHFYFLNYMKNHFNNQLAAQRSVSDEVL
jgi:hypothetical protein